MRHLTLFSQGVFEIQVYFTYTTRSGLAVSDPSDNSSGQTGRRRPLQCPQLETSGHGALRTEHVPSLLSHLPPATQGQVEARPLVPLGLLKGLPLWGTKGPCHLSPVAPSPGENAPLTPRLFTVFSAAPPCEFVQSESIRRPSQALGIGGKCGSRPWGARSQGSFSPHLPPHPTPEPSSFFLSCIFFLPLPGLTPDQPPLTSHSTLGLVSISEFGLVPPHPGEVSEVYESLASRIAGWQR